MMWTALLCHAFPPMMVWNHDQNKSFLL
jgi:hypothetical protein